MKQPKEYKKQAEEKVKVNTKEKRGKTKHGRTVGAAPWASGTHAHSHPLTRSRAPAPRRPEQTATIKGKAGKAKRGKERKHLDGAAWRRGSPGVPRSTMLCDVTSPLPAEWRGRRVTGRRRLGNYVEPMREHATSEQALCCSEILAPYLSFFFGFSEDPSLQVRSKAALASLSPQYGRR
ncbi:hypothetical protein MRX96_043518 [Rhipicephalus microplus]